MIKRKVALIGHSGAGKSTCIKLMGGRLDVADMDKARFATLPPSVEEALNWMVTNDESILSISVHRDTLFRMTQAKKMGSDARFHELFFLYLYRAKEKLSASLEKPTAYSTYRDNGNKAHTMKDYAELDRIFRELADSIIDTSNLEVQQVVENIKSLVA